MDTVLDPLVPALHKHDIDSSAWLTRTMHSLPSSVTARCLLPLTARAVSVVAGTSLETVQFSVVLAGTSSETVLKQ